MNVLGRHTSMVLNEWLRLFLAKLHPSAVLCRTRTSSVPSDAGQTQQQGISKAAKKLAISATGLRLMA